MQTRIKSILTNENRRVKNIIDRNKNIEYIKNLINIKLSEGDE